MARPTKQTVDYFPHSVNHKKTIPLLKSKFGSDGYAVFMQTLELLGKSEGHFFDFSDEIDWLFYVSEMGVSEEKAKDILDFCSRLKAFDQKLFKSKILWSDNFVENLRQLYSKRTIELPLKPKITADEPVNDTGNGVNDTRNPQSKVKKSKVKKSKKDIINGFNFNDALFSRESVESLFSHRKGKKAPIVSQLTLDGILNKCIECHEAGYFSSPEKAVLEIPERGWQTIKTEWCKNAGIKKVVGKSGTKQGAGGFSGKDYQAGATSDDDLPECLR